MTILDEIIEHKKKEVRKNMRKISIKDLKKSKNFERETLLFTDYLLRPGKSGIIAEYKKKSPSRGIINESAEVGEITTGYANEGASGLSVLTDSKYFGGSGKDLVKARKLNSIPVLRKDFVISEYQVVEAKSIGADAILLIAAALTNEHAKELARLAKSLKMQVILEVHNSKELDFLNEYIDIAGVNNRNLKDFTVDINTSVDLAERIGKDFIKISESGIGSPETIKKLKEIGYQGFLIGEKFMMQDDPVKAFSRFVKDL